MWTQEKAMGDMVTMTRKMFENGVRSMDFFQDQFMKNMDMTLNNMKTMQEGTREIISASLEQYNQLRRGYSELIDEGMSTIERQYRPAEHSQPASRSGK